MPIYQYRCLNCKKRFEVFLSYKEYGAKNVLCPHCTSEQVQRRIGRVRIAKSEESRLDDLTDTTNLEGLENDPRALGRMMRKMSNEMGEDVGPEFDEVVDRLESGQSPEDIEKAIPDLEGGAGNYGDDIDY
jgi:putative FmdB family regulatory protein